MNNWLVIANASRARVFEEIESEEQGVKHCTYAHVANLVHPQSRQKGVALANDRPGHAHAEGRGLGGTSYAPHTDPREREHDRFAREVAHLLDDGIAAHRCGGLVLVASSPFLGHLKGHLGVQAKKVVVRTRDADYTALSERELVERLAQPQSSA